MTLDDIDEIESQLDSTAPYYVPQLLHECRSAYLTLQRIGQGECSEPETCVEARPNSLCGRCRARIFLSCTVPMREGAR